MRSLCFVGVLALALCGCGDHSIPLQDQQVLHQTELPSSIRLLTALDAQRQGAFNPESTCVVFPEGAGSTGDRPTLSWSMQLDAPFTGSAWLRTRWADSCGNSVTLILPGFPPRVVGEDSVYGEWHWVEVPQVSLPEGEVTITVEGREDGIAVDQLLLSADADFVPRGHITSNGQMAFAPRRFADDFNRSPGHGLDNWEILSGEWNIAFSFDPNRIPNQYSLTGKATEGPADILIDDMGWSGFRLKFHAFPRGTNALLILLNDGKQHLEISDFSAQWHEVVIEQWGSTLRGWVDGDMRLDRTITPPGGRIGIGIDRGSISIDDVNVEEIFWKDLNQLNYTVEGDWTRDPKSNAIVGRSGALTLDAGDNPISAVAISSEKIIPGVQIPPDSSLKIIAGHMLLNRTDAEPTLRVAPMPGHPLHIDTLYARLTPPPPPQRVAIGPYHFSEQKLFDPSDYHDFTEEEQAHITSEEHKDVLERKPRLFPVLGKRSQNSAWVQESGKWRVHDGVLTGDGSPAVVSHGEPIGVSFILTGRVRPHTPETQLELLRSTTAKPLVTPEQIEAAPADGWIPFELAMPAETGDEAIDEIVRLRITGGADLDDLLFSRYRRHNGEYTYTFEQREPDVQRLGGQWIDHAGIACIIASSWISLVAPESSGSLMHKFDTGPDVSIAFTIEEYSTWYGWEQKPSHQHHAFDNLAVSLLDADGEPVYELCLNSVDGNKRSTHLQHRDQGTLVTIPQDESFPIQYRGGHSPYAPRTNRIYVKIENGEIVAAINGEVILRYQDEDPLPVKRVGIRGYHTHVNISNIEIRDLSDNP